MDIELPEIDKEKIKEIKMKQKDRIMKNPEFASFIAENNLSQFEVYDHLGYFSKALESRIQCEKCPGVNKCPTKGYMTKVCYENKKLFNKICPCQKLLQGISIKSKFVKYDFRYDLLYATLKDSLNNFANERKIIVRDLVTKIKTNDFSRGFYLYGEEGIGKSYIMHAFANQIALKDLGMICYIDLKATCADLINDSFKNPADYAEDMELFEKVDFLFIDNFGEEEKTDFSKSNIIVKILSEREKNQLPTFIISSYSPDELKEAYKTPKTLYAHTNEIINYIKNNCDIRQLIQMKYPF